MADDTSPQNELEFEKEDTTFFESTQREPLMSEFDMADDFK